MADEPKRTRQRRCVFCGQFIKWGEPTMRLAPHEVMHNSKERPCWLKHFTSNFPDAKPYKAKGLT